MNELHEHLFKILKKLPSDYSDYGGNIKRWERDDTSYPDCSCGCKYFIALGNNLVSNDWGICCNEKSPRAGLLTWEHQAGFKCFEEEEKEGDI